MKVKLFSTAVLIFAITIANAQKDVFKAGLKAGANINKISGKSFEQQFSFGYQGGAFD